MAEHGPFYHVNIHDVNNIDKGLLKPGVVYEAGQSYSSFWLRPYEVVWTPKVGQESVGIIDYYASVCDGRSPMDDLLKARLVPFAGEMLKGVRELVLEKERTGNNPSDSRPSRLKCLFAATSPESAQAWAGVVLAEGRSEAARAMVNSSISRLPHAAQAKAAERVATVGAHQVVEIMVDGEALIVDARWIEHDWIPIKEMEKRAQAYWSGERTADPKLEVLISGNFRVTRAL